MTGGLLREVLSWAAPPLVGAVIGWVTNDIAIRMLFRPLREIRVLGLRLPFTPGIFPKERRSLALSIGRMVSAELITEEALRRQLRSGKAQAALARGLSSVTTEVLDAPLSAMSDLGHRAGLAPSIEQALESLLAGLLGSPSFRHGVQGVVETALGSPGARAFLADRLLPMLAREGVRQAVARAVREGFRDTGRLLFTDSLLDAGARALEPLLPLAATRIAEWLRSAPMRKELEARGTALLSTILDKLNLVQRILVNAGQFDRRLSEKMPEIVDEAIAALETLAADPDRQRKVLELLVQAVKDLGIGKGAGKLGDAAADLVDGLMARFSDEEVRREILARLDQSIGGLAARILDIREENLAGWVADRVVKLLQGPGTAGALSAGIVSMAGRFVSDNGSRPLGAVLGIDAERKAGLDAFLLARLLELVDAKLPEILRGLDVEQLVVEKIDALDVRDVERLILQVIATHLKWINVFGAILGFAIGLLQDLLRLLRAW